MRIPIYALTAILSVVLLAVAIPKLSGQKQMHDRLVHLGVSDRTIPLLGVLELSAVVGFLIGLVWAPLGIAAAVGLMAQMVGATVLHARAKDGMNEIGTPIAFGVAAAALAVLHALTL